MKERILREIKLGLALAPFAIPIGMGIVYLLLALIMGSFADALSLILISIVCTAFISLFIWVPIWYAAGYGVIVLLRLALGLVGVDVGGIFSPKKAAPAVAKPQPEPGKLQALSSQLDQDLSQGSTLSHDQLALINYIKKARAKGLTNEQISRNLSNNGWNTESISAAFQLV